jgi:hypothetical protein
MAGGASRFAFRFLSTLIAIPIGKAIASATGKAWSAARPHDPPHDPKRIDTDWKDALFFATITGLGTAIAQLLSTKGADTVWRAATGRPPPQPKSKTKSKTGIKTPSDASE